MRRSISLTLVCAGIATIATSAVAQTRPGRTPAAPAAPAMMMNGPGDGRADVSLEALVMSDELRAAVRAKDVRKINAVLATLTVTVPSGPVNQILCPPPRIIWGGRCTLPVIMQMDPFGLESQK